MRRKFGGFARPVAPIAVALIALTAAIAGLLSTSWDQGLHLAYVNGEVVVDSVDYGTVAQLSGLQPGDVVVKLDGQNVLGASDAEKAQIAASHGPWTNVQTVPRYLVGDEIASINNQAAAEAFDSLLAQLGLQRGAYGCQPEPSCAVSLPSMFQYVDYSDWHFLTVAPAPPEPVILGLAILLLGWWFVGHGHAGATLKSYALTLPVATAVPLLVLPVDRYPSLPATALASALVPLAMIPLAIDFLEGVEGRRRRWLVVMAVMTLAVGSEVAGLLIPSSQGGHGIRIWRAILAGGIAFVPGVFAARPSVAGVVARLPFGRPKSESSVESGRSPRKLVESVDLLLAAMTPGIAALSLAPAYSIDLSPVLFWFALLLVATRFSIRPFVRLATRAMQQRDMVVAATEAERARIAADIHDDALQDLTMLVRRLDAAGDKANAGAAREIAERLRAICGDLRLPVLDDLGVGPALDWLCSRLSSTTVPIKLDRLAEESRLPAEVELAIFRVAQEGVSNAIRHGAPPIVVRYREGDGWIELEVDDAGPGLAGDAAEKAELTGHLGLLNMAQRADAVGATLKIGRRPGGGTRVSLVWEREASASGAAASGVEAARGATAAGVAAPPASSATAHS